MHKDVSVLFSAARAKQITTNNAKTNVFPANFGFGDFLLVRPAQKNKGHKLNFSWKGPRRIVGVERKLVFNVESLLVGRREHVHGR